LSLQSAKTAEICGISEKLPVVVEKYFHLVLNQEKNRIQYVHLTQEGQFRLKEWHRFKAAQTFSLHPPGFEWNATIRLAPFIHAKVRDSLEKGLASMRARLFGLLPLVNTSSSQELLIAAMQRYLAESAWFPTALLSGEQIKWKELDGNHAIATLKDSGVEASLQFQFNDIGEITRIFTPERPRFINGKITLTPWAGYFSHYEERNGFRIPMEARVEWILPEGAFPYFIGRVTAIQHQ
jgi:hypothetical protein